MYFYWLDALSPLVFRSGKPFGTQSDNAEIMFPLPSSAAGLLRSTFARQQQMDFTGHFDVADLRKKSLNGLFLAQRNQDNHQMTLFVPKPNDCVYLPNPQDKNQTDLVRLMLQQYNEECGSDLPHGLLPVQISDSAYKGKPKSGHVFWRLDDYLKWQQGERLSFQEIEQNGVSLPAPDVRTHVAIESETQASKDGALFQTAAYDFAPIKNPHHNGWQNTQLGFVLASDAMDLRDDCVCFGGEGRLAQLIPITNTLPNPPLNLIDKRFKLTLLTPAIFANGWLPKWLNPNSLEGELPHVGLRVKLYAAAVDRWIPVSGWDLAQDKPKAMRKAVAAGAVYWFELLDDVADAPEQLAGLMYQSICDDEQDKRDGFGLVVSGSV